MYVLSVPSIVAPTPIEAPPRTEGIHTSGRGEEARRRETYVWYGGGGTTYKQKTTRREPE